jgi:hypothetical protein
MRTPPWLLVLCMLAASQPCIGLKLLAGQRVVEGFVQTVMVRWRLCVGPTPDRHGLLGMVLSPPCRSPGPQAPPPQRHTPLLPARFAATIRSIGYRLVQLRGEGCARCCTVAPCPLLGPCMLKRLRVGSRAPSPAATRAAAAPHRLS